MLSQETYQNGNPIPSSEGLRRGVKNDRVFRILLSNPEGNLSKYRISKLTLTQQIQISHLLRPLYDSHLVIGTQVMDPKGVVMKWSKLSINYQSQTYMLPDILRVLKETALDYALTTYQAESMVDHYLFPTRVELYIRPDDVEAWHNLLVEAGASVGGGNVRLRWYDDHVLDNSFEVNGYKIVSVPQLVVDLFREGGVATEGADMIMRKYDAFMRLNRANLCDNTRTPAIDR